MGIKSQIEVRMIKSVQFRNFKVLRDATLPLGRFTLIVGPNGSGKSTALQALQAVTNPPQFYMVATAGLQSKADTAVEVVLQWGTPYEGVVSTAHWSPSDYSLSHQDSRGMRLPDSESLSLRAKWTEVRIYSLDAAVVAHHGHWIQPAKH